MRTWTKEELENALPDPDAKPIEAALTMKEVSEALNDWCIKTGRIPAVPVQCVMTVMNQAVHLRFHPLKDPQQGAGL